MPTILDEDKPKRKSPFGKRPRRPLRPKRRWWPNVPKPLDIDLVKFENLEGNHCQCGQRRVDGACFRCQGLDQLDAVW